VYVGDERFSAMSLAAKLRTVPAWLGHEAAAAAALKGYGMKVGRITVQRALQRKTLGQERAILVPGSSRPAHPTFPNRSGPPYPSRRHH